MSRADYMASLDELAMYAASALCQPEVAESWTQYVADKVRSLKDGSDG